MLNCRPGWLISFQPSSESKRSTLQNLGCATRETQPFASAVTERNATIITKDHDFVSLARGHRIPSLVLLTCGNVSNARLREIMTKNFPRILLLLESGERVVEVTD